MRLGLFHQDLTKVVVTTTAIADQPTYGQGKTPNPHHKG